MINYTLRQLQYFVAVAELGSISAAAKQCHISQAAMSQSMDELERAVGSQLLVRRGARGVVLTAVGTDFLLDSRALVRHAEEVQDLIVERQTKLSGPMVIGCYSSLAAFWIPV
ncbi:MAG: LysR family transcriptional regulator, partial [Glutamicibacter arilaitensis]